MSVTRFCIFKKITQKSCTFYSGIRCTFCSGFHCTLSPEFIVHFGTEYSGNLTADDNKQITAIQYNYLNLPTHLDITAKEGKEGGSIDYLYDAAGIKLRQVKHGNTLEETNYIGSFVYNGTDSLTYIQTPYGRILKKADGTYENEYFLTDHLSNTHVIHLF